MGELIKSSKENVIEEWEKGRRDKKEQRKWERTMGKWENG